jgi:hypothetical protein
MAPERPVVSKRSGGRKGRARKRRPAAGERPSSPAGEAKQQQPTGSGRTRHRAPTRASGRPPAPWHPLPLSELLILVGAVAVLIAFSDHLESHLALLGVGLAAVAIGTLEVTVREHLAGYRSHALLLAIIPPIALHSSVILVLAGFVRVPRWVNIPLLALDIALFTVIFRYLRGRYRDARRVRAFAGGR